MDLDTYHYQRRYRLWIFKLAVLNRAIYRGLYQEGGQMVVYSFAECQVYPVVQVNKSFYILHRIFHIRKINANFIYSNRSLFLKWRFTAKNFTSASSINDSLIIQC